MDKKKLITSKEAADILEVTKTTVNKLAREGKLPFIRKGRSNYFSLSVIQDYKFKKDEANEFGNPYFCEVCGKKLEKRWKYKGKKLCFKHRNQLINHGCFLDNNPRTEWDKNTSHDIDDYTVVDVYGRGGSEKVGEFLIDKRFKDQILKYKWCFTWSKENPEDKRPMSYIDGKPYYLHRYIYEVILGEDLTDFVIDHISRNPLDNRLSNLRKCKQIQNTRNYSIPKNNKSGFHGVVKQGEGFRSYVGYKSETVFLGWHFDFKEAIYSRYIGENLLYKDFVNKDENERKRIFTQDLSYEIKQEIEKKVIEKLTLAGLISSDDSLLSNSLISQNSQQTESPSQEVSYA